MSCSRPKRRFSFQAEQENCRYGLDRALCWMGTLEATALAIDEFLNDLALGGAPAGDNLPAALGTNSYFVGAGFEHKGARG